MNEGHLCREENGPDIVTLYHVNNTMMDIYYAYMYVLVAHEEGPSWLLNKAVLSCVRFVNKIVFKY